MAEACSSGASSSCGESPPHPTEQHLTSGQRRRQEHLGGPEVQRELWQKKKADAKSRRRERKQAEKEQRNAAWDALTEEERESRRKVAHEHYDLRREQQQAHAALCRKRLVEELGPRLVFDLSFETVMVDRGRRSTAQQLQYSYSLIRQAAFVLRPQFMGVDPEGIVGKQLHGYPGFKAFPPLITADDVGEVLADSLNQVIYLTADSSTVLRTLDDDKVYVVGAFVDHNSKKNATLEKANKLGIATARLPLDEAIDIGNKAKVLTINHVVEALLKYKATGDWSTAFTTTLPVRRDRQAGKRERNNTAQDEGSSSDGE